MLAGVVLRLANVVDDGAECKDLLTLVSFASESQKEPLACGARIDTKRLLIRSFTEEQMTAWCVDRNEKRVKREN